MKLAKHRERWNEILRLLGLELHDLALAMSTPGGRVAVQAALALCAAALCWIDVSWALRRGLFLYMDELSNQQLFLTASYAPCFHLLPTQFYGDHALPLAFVKLMFDRCEFSYTGQLICFLAIHFANCVLVFLLFRRLGASVPVSLAGVALFGSLWTTAQAATYGGAIHDLICLFFLLMSVLAIWWDWRGASILSAILYLAALRSKEFAIVLPVALTVLIALRVPWDGLWKTASAILRRLWLHYVILAVFGLRYLSLYQAYRAGIGPGNPYRMDLHFSTVLNSVAYYTALIFSAETFHLPVWPILLALGLVAIFGWAILRRRAGIAFGVCAYVLTLLPVSLISNRATYYVYAPQVFLFLVLCLLANEALHWKWKADSVRWVAGVCVALAVMALCLHFRRSEYFRRRVNFNIMVRRACARSAHDLNAQLPRLGPGTRIYVDHAAGLTPWLFEGGPCSYLRLANRQPQIDCEIDQPSGELHRLYAGDTGPRSLLDYHEDGAIMVVDRAGLPAAPNR